MENSLRNDRVCTKLKRYFKGNIEIYFKTELEIIIITKDGKFHRMIVNSEEFIKFSLIDDEENNNQYIESTIIDILYDKSIKNIYYGWSHVFAKTVKNEIYCWGGNNLGQIGNGTIDENIEIPEFNTYLSEKNLSEITCGYDHSLALNENGDVFAWGDNSMGQIGNGSDEKFQLFPIKLENFDSEKVVAISCGAYHSMCLTDVGHVWSWGSNNKSQLGIEEISLSRNPKMIKLENVTIGKISCGRNHNLLLSTDGYILTFGDNSSGQLGTGSKINETHPLRLIDLEPSKDISSYLFNDISVSHSINNNFYAWGKLGDAIETLPKRKNFKSFDQVFLESSKVCKEPIKKIPSVEENIINNGLFARTFLKFSEIGAGSFGTVFKVENNLTHYITAVKKISSLAEESMYFKEFKNFHRMLKKQNDHIVKNFQCWFENENNYNGNSLSLYIQMELCDKTLTDIMEDMEKNLDFTINENLTPLGTYICCEIFLEILEGVDFLHKNQIIHRDLKPDNILLKKRLSRNWVKIADFGLLAYHENENIKHTPDTGTLKFMAPEVGKGLHYNTKSDIFSLGKVFEKLFRMEGEDAYENINSGLSDYKYENRRDVYCRMTNKNYQNRPDCDVIIDEQKIWAIGEQELLERQNFKIEEKPKSFILSYYKSKLRMKKFDELSSNDEQKKLIGELITNNILMHILVAKSMLLVDRKLFCSTTECNPYEDKPKEIGYGTTISAPTIHAIILELFRKYVKNDSKILDIGSGIGYLTICLAHMSDYNQVFGVEHALDLAEKSRNMITNNFPDLMDRIKIINQDGSKGFEPGAPYMAINIGFALTHVPEEILSQLKIGGRLIVPLQLDDGKQKLTTIDKLQDGTIEKKFHKNVRFKLIDSVPHQTE